LKENDSLKAVLKTKEAELANLKQMVDRLKPHSSE